MDDAIIKQIQETIRVTVNGKIDAISAKMDANHVEHQDDMKRILPVLVAYESAQNGGRLALKIGGGITIIGGAWLTLKSIFPWL